MCMLIIIAIIFFLHGQCIEIGGALYLDATSSSFCSKSETLFVLSSITKKGAIESTSRPLMDFSD
jgi:hypothetical protein